MTDLNLPGESHAHSLIAAGRVDRTSAWSFEAADGNALLGKSGDDWTTYGNFHLGIDRSAAEKTKGRFKYPFGKGGKVYRAGVIAAKQRAAQQGDAAVERAAGDLLEKIDATKSASRGRFERKVTSFEFKFSDGDGAGSFEGYGSVFNVEDDYGDMIVPGAFQKTLADHRAAGTMPKMLLNHGGMGSMFASPGPEDMLPVGKWTNLSEDSKGLHCKGRLINLDTDSGKRLHGAMKEGELDGLSIGYQAKDFVRGTKENEPRRTLKGVHLFEISPVTFPANEHALVSSVKNTPRIGTIREFEDFLRDVGGFSVAAARAIAAGGFKANPDPRDEAGRMGDLVRELRGVNARF